MASLKQYGVRLPIQTMDLFFSLGSLKKARFITAHLRYFDPGQPMPVEVERQLRILGVRRYGPGQNPLARADHYLVDDTFAFVGYLVEPDREKPMMVTGWVADAAKLPKTQGVGSLREVKSMLLEEFTDLPSDEAIRNGWVKLGKTETGPSALDLLSGLFDDKPDFERTVQFKFNTAYVDRPLRVTAIANTGEGEYMLLLHDSKGHGYNVNYDPQKRSGTATLPYEP